MVTLKATIGPLSWQGPLAVSTYIPSGFTSAGLLSFAFTDAANADLPMVVNSIVQEADSDGAVKVTVRLSTADPDWDWSASGELLFVIA